MPLSLSSPYNTLFILLIGFMPFPAMTQEIQFPPKQTREILNEMPAGKEAELKQSEGNSISVVRGRLREKGTRKPLAQVNVFILPHKLKGTTDNTGRFRIENIPQGPIDIVANATGYQRLELKRDLGEEELNLDLYLERTDDSVFETTVVGQREKRDLSGGTLSRDEFLYAPGSRGDPLVALENKPGIQTYDFANGVIIQGADPEDTKYSINGHEVPLVFHFLGNSSVFIPDVVDEVEYLAAGFGPEYGRSIGGNVGLVTRKPRDDRYHGMAYVDLLNAGGLVEGPISDDQSFWIAGRYSYLGFVFDLIASQDSAVTLREAPQYWDMEGTYLWKMTSRDEFKFTGIAASDSLKLFVRDFDDPFFRGDITAQTSFFRVIPQWTHRFNEESTFDASLGFGNDDLVFAIGDQAAKVDSWRLTLRSEYMNRFNEHLKVFWGVDSLYAYNQLDVRVPASFFSEIFTNQDTPLSVSNTIRSKGVVHEADFGVYFRQQIRPRAKSPWLFQPNLRVNYFTLTDRFHLQPRGELSYRLDDHWTLRGASGLYFQSPELIQVDKNAGNPNLKDEKAIHYSMGAIADFRDDLKYGFKGEVDLFYKDISNRVIPTDDVNIIGGEIRPVWYTNEGSGEILGSQLSLSYVEKKWSLTLAYTYSRSRKTQPDDGTFPSLFERPHDLNTIGTYQLGNWNISTRIRLISGNPYTPIIDASYDLDNDVFRPIQGQELSERIPYFFQWDLRVDRKWIFDTWILTLYFDVLNVLNRDNINEIEYSFDYTEQRPEAGIPILPTFGVKGEF